MENTKKFEELTKEQQTGLKVAGRKMVLSMFLNGVNFGALIVIANLVLMLADATFFQSKPLLLILCMVTDFTLLRMMMSAIKEATDSFKEKVKNILEAQ